MPEAAPSAEAGAIRAASLREAGPLLSDRDAGLMTHAVALANWHATHQHCPRCGALAEPYPPGMRGAARWMAVSTSPGVTRP